MASVGEQLFARFAGMKSMREGFWEDKWQQIADRMLGRRDFIVQESPGRRREREIYDTTGRTMVNLLSGGLHSLLTNPATQWFDLRTEDTSLMEIHEVNLWLDRVTSILLATFQRPEHRFVSQQDEVFLDLVAFGTGTMFIGDTAGQPVLFSARPLSEIYLAENQNGRVDTVFRKFRMTARQVVLKWGGEAPEKARKAVSDGRSEEDCWLLHAVFPSNDPARPDDLPRNRLAFDSVFLSVDEKKVLGRPNGYEEQPYLVARWRVDGGEVYGRGPGDDALADQKMASAMKQVALQSVQMSMAPPFITEDDGSIIQLDMRPFGRNIVKPGGFLNPPIQALDTGARIQMGIDLIRDTRQQVEEAFHFELLKLIQNRGLTPMTARQATLIQNSVERLLAPILGRQHEDYLGPMIDRVYGILLRRNEIPAPPPALSGQPLKIEYVSPITRAQKRGDVDATLQFLQSLVEIEQIRPGTMDLVDLDEAMRFVGVQSDVPASVMRSRRDIVALRQIQAQLASEQQAKEDQREGAKALGAAAPALQLLRGGEAA